MAVYKTALQPFLAPLTDPKTGHLQSQSQPEAPFPIPQGNLKLLDIEE